MTRSQQRVYDALVLLTEGGWPASVREIAEVAGYSSSSTVQFHLNNLESLGFARRHPNAPETHRGWLPGIRRP